MTWSDKFMIFENNICDSGDVDKMYKLTSHQKQILDKLSIYKRTIRGGWISRCALKGVKNGTIHDLVDMGYIESAMVADIWTIRYTGKIYLDRYEDAFGNT